MFLQRFARAHSPPIHRLSFSSVLDGNEWRMCGSQVLEHPRGKCHKVRDILLCACQNELCNGAQTTSLRWSSAGFTAFLSFIALAKPIYEILRVH
jgi:hypothetical protein